ncbi:MAG: hypothetical protein ACI9MS_002650 [Glaciecola sp.]|jgi:hypothetical protein
MKSLFFFFTLLFFKVCWGVEESYLHTFEQQEGAGNQPIKIDPIREEEQTNISFIDYSHDWLKEYIDDFSYNVDGFFIDTFFSDDIIEDDVSGSRAKLSFFTRREIGQPVGYNYGISIKLVLPNTNEHFKLLFQSSEDEEAERENDPINTVDNVEYSTALRYVFQETDRWKVNFDTGIRWGIPSDPFSRLRFRRYAYFDDFRVKATQSFLWSGNDGFGEESKVELNQPLNIDRLIRYSVGAKYLLNEDFFDLNYGMTLFHELNSSEIIAYYYRAAGDTISNMTFNNYGIGVRYRRKIYQDWMFAEVNPELETQVENEYDITPIIMFRFEALIGVR